MRRVGRKLQKQKNDLGRTCELDRYGLGENHCGTRAPIAASRCGGVSVPLRHPVGGDEVSLSSVPEVKCTQFALESVFPVIPVDSEQAVPRCAGGRPTRLQILRTARKFKSPLREK